MNDGAVHFPESAQENRRDVLVEAALDDRFDQLIGPLGPPPFDQRQPAMFDAEHFAQSARPFDVNRVLLVAVIGEGHEIRRAVEDAEAEAAIHAGRQGQ